MTEATKLAREALVRARDFIRNGIELGFIRMPDPDTPDPAHETPRLIDEALSALSTAPGESEGALADPTAADLEDPTFNAIWNAIKRWDISRDGSSGSYHGPTGTDVMTILRAIRSTPPAAPAGEAGEYLIWSNEHRAWWRPKSQGYTVHTKAAGRYSRAEALDVCRARNSWNPNRAPDEVPVPAGDVAEIEARALAQEPRNG